MAVTARLNPNCLVAAFNKEIDFNSDTISFMLLDNTYVPSDAHDYLNDVRAKEVVGTGYTADGATLGSCTMTYIAANSWATARANSTAYALGQYVRPASGNGYLYQAIVAGTSAGTIPTYPTTIGATVSDGGVTWLCVGKGAVVLDGNDVSWAASTITAAFGVVYDKTPGTDATRPLLATVDFGGDKISSSGTFSVPWDAAGIAILTIP